MQRFNDWGKFRPAMVLLVLSAPAFNPHLFGQEARDPFRSSDGPWVNSNQPAWEKEMHGSQPSDGWNGNGSESNYRPEAVQGPLTVSAEELRHPISKNGRKILEKAEKYVRAGDHKRAIEALNLALKEPSAAPYAHGILGVQYLEVNRITEAVAEFSQAVILRPRSAMDHSNLGLALCMGGQTARGLEEIDEALTLDQRLLRARFLKAVILMDRDSNGDETWEYLQTAQREVPIAHLALALFYKRHGQGAAAQQQLQDFARLGLGVTLTQGQHWLAAASAEAPAAAVLGLWHPVEVKSSAVGE
jgi:tetratricopeptide (TPR) repeat protein